VDTFLRVIIFLGGIFMLFVGFFVVLFMTSNLQGGIIRNLPSLITAWSIPAAGIILIVFANKFNKWFGKKN